MPTLHSAAGIHGDYIKQVALVENLKVLRKKYAHLVIDEMSMLHPSIFSQLFQACLAADLGLVLVGDFLQLPAVPDDDQKKFWQKAGWLFESDHWKKFQVLKLTTQFRQSGQFLDAMQCLRTGNGKDAYPLLKECGAHFLPLASPLPKGYAGLIIVATNARRRAINSAKFNALKGKAQKYLTTHDKGVTEDDKKNAAIPEYVTLKKGARVRILRNLYAEDKKTLLQRNGELGTVTKMTKASVSVLRDGYAAGDGATVSVEYFAYPHNMQRHAILHAATSEHVQHFVIDIRIISSFAYGDLGMGWHPRVLVCSNAVLDHL